MYKVMRRKDNKGPEDFDGDIEEVKFHGRTRNHKCCLLASFAASMIAFSVLGVQENSDLSQRLRGVRGRPAIALPSRADMMRDSPTNEQETDVRIHDLEQLEQDAHNAKEQLWRAHHARLAIGKRRSLWPDPSRPP